MDKRFRFLPRWRRDDAQISLAATGGSIGPHVDNYDVFLIQTTGTRKWQVGLAPLSVETEFDRLIPRAQVRILNTTTTPLETASFDLSEGDCLYVPPRYMHCGIATSNDCSTLSVGCRAPSAAELLSKIATFAATSTLTSANQRYTDIDLFKAPNMKNLSQEVKTDMKNLVLSLVDEVLGDNERWGRLVGEVATEPVRPADDYPVPLRHMDTEWKASLGVWGHADSALQAVFGGLGILRRAEGISFAWSISCNPLGGKLYAQGQEYDLLPNEDSALTYEHLRQLLERIADGDPIDHEFFVNLAGDTASEKGISDFFYTLLDEGIIYGESFHIEE